MRAPFFKKPKHRKSRGLVAVVALVLTAVVSQPGNSAFRILELAPDRLRWDLAQLAVDAGRVPREDPLGCLISRYRSGVYVDEIGCLTGLIEVAGEVARHPEPEP